MNRAVALRIAACGILGLGAALLIAALLLSTYTQGKIAKIPLDIDTTLVSDGNAAPPSIPRRCHGPKFVDRQERAAWFSSSRSASRRRRTPTWSRCRSARRCGAPTSRRTTVCCWRWSTPSRSNRKTAMAVSSESNPAAPCRSRAPSTTTSRRPTSRCRTRARLPLPVRHREEDVSVLRPDRAEAVRRQLRRRRGRQRPDHLPVQPERRLRRRRQARRTGQVPVAVRQQRGRQVTARAALWGLPGDPDEQITMTRYYAAQRTFWVDPVSGTIVKTKERGQPLLRAASRCKPEVTFVDYTVTSNEADGRVSRSPQRATSGTGWRCGAASCRSRSPPSGSSRWSAARCWDRSACGPSPR